MLFLMVFLKITIIENTLIIPSISIPKDNITWEVLICSLEMNSNASWDIWLICLPYKMLTISSTSHSFLFTGGTIPLLSVMGI